MQYQVIARKWRPRNFHELVGQEHVSRSLLNSLTSGRLAHAFLFSGPRGSGKTSSARILAKALNCHENQSGEPCDHCPSCVEIAAGTSMDVLEIDAASNRGIDDIRELKDQVRYHPARDRNKIFIIDEVHMLTTEASNALLKTLEEPPPNVVFILATTELHKILPTIRSRCQQYTFKLVPYPLILNRLREITRAENINISDSALEQVAFASGGSMRDAMSAMDQVLAFTGSEVRDEDVASLLGMVETKVLDRTTRALAANDVATLLTVVADLTESGQDLTNFCRRLSGQFRNLMVVKAGVTDLTLLGVPESLLPELRAQSELFSREDLIRLFDVFQKVESGMRYANQVRFHLEMGLIELAHAARLQPIEELLARFSTADSLQAENATVRDAGRPPASLPPPGRAPLARPTPPPATQPPAPQAQATQPQAQQQRYGASGGVSGIDAMPPPWEPSSAPAPPPRREPPAFVPAAQPAGQSAQPPAKQSQPPQPTDRNDLLGQIIAAVRDESLRGQLRSFAGARLTGNSLLLDPGSASKFTQNRVQERLAEIAAVAATVIGAEVTATLSSTASAPPTAARAVASSPSPAASQRSFTAPTPPGATRRVPASNPPADTADTADKQGDDIREKIKQDPIVQSFIDYMPGTVSVEKIEK